MITINQKNRILGHEPYDTEYKGLSTDEKPSENIAVNSLFLELDTGDFYYFDGLDWNKVGSGASPTPTGDGYEITNPVLTLNISGVPQDIELAYYVDENGYLTYAPISNAYGETKVVVVGFGGLYQQVYIPKSSSYSNEVNCTAEIEDVYLLITITDPTQDASIDVEYGLS